MDQFFQGTCFNFNVLRFNYHGVDFAFFLGYFNFLIVAKTFCLVHRRPVAVYVDKKKVRHKGVEEGFFSTRVYTIASKDEENLVTGEGYKNQ